MGLIPRTLPFTKRNTIVRAFRHAIALDERRAKFKANVWDQPVDKKKADDLAAAESEYKKKNPKPPRNPKKVKRNTIETKYSQHSDELVNVKEVCVLPLSPPLQSLLNKCAL